MNKIRQHIPGFAQPCRAEEVEFETLDELLNINFVKNFKVSRMEKKENLPFYQFSLSDNMLMAEWKNEQKHRWWVIGTLDNICNINLPKFDSTIVNKKVRF